MATSLLPEPKIQFFDNNGNPLSGGKVHTYQPATLIAKATYSDSTGAIPNANPVILDSAGRASIWLDGYYRVILRTSADVTIYDVDNVSSMMSTNLTSIQWHTEDYAFTFINATQMTTPGIVTSTFKTGMRLQADVTAGTITGTVSGSSSGGFPVITTINCIWDTGALDAGLSEVRTGIITTASNALPILAPSVRATSFSLTIPDLNNVFIYNNAVAQGMATPPAATEVPPGAWFKFKNANTATLMIGATVEGFANPILRKGDEITIYSGGAQWLYGNEMAPYGGANQKMFMVS